MKKFLIALSIAILVKLMIYFLNRYVLKVLIDPFFEGWLCATAYFGTISYLENESNERNP